MSLRDLIEDAERLERVANRAEYEAQQSRLAVRSALGIAPQACVIPALGGAWYRAPFHGKPAVYWSGSGADDPRPPSVREWYCDEIDHAAAPADVERQVEDLTLVRTDGDAVMVFETTRRIEPSERRRGVP